MERCTRCEICTDQCRVAEELAGTFKALGDLNRLKIITFLAADTTGTLGVGDLATRLGISQPAVSQHLKTLKGAGLIESRKTGFHVYFTFNRERMSRFREQFDQISTSVLDRCDREFLRAKSPELRNSCVIYHSFTGTTRSVAEKVRDFCGGDLVEVTPKRNYGTFTAYTTGCLRSRNGDLDPIVPDLIDVSPYSLLVIGTPVWAWRSTPAINAAVAALSNCEGKRAVIYATCSGQVGEALTQLRRALEARGVTVIGEVTFTKRDLLDPDRNNDLIRRIVSAGTAESPDQREMKTMKTPEPGEDLS